MVRKPPASMLSAASSKVSGAPPETETPEDRYQIPRLWHAIMNLVISGQIRDSYMLEGTLHWETG